MASRTLTNKVKQLWPWIAGCAALIALAFAWLLLPLGEWIKAFGMWIEGFGIAGAVVFGLVYIAATLVLAPAGLLTIAAGVAFGWWALPLVLISATAGATAAMVIGRYLLRDKVREAIKGRRNFSAAVEAVDEEGWKVLVLLRLSPAVPFGAQNYLAGLTDITLATYVAATAGGIAPGTLLYVYLGVIGGKPGAGGTAQWGFLIAGLLASIVVVVLVSVKAKEKLKDKGVAKSSNKKKK
ncbi:MAG: TVP38/TMEM64 family protein [Pseudolabrys sp.]